MAEIAFMDNFYSIVEEFRPFIPLARTIITVVVTFIIFSIVLALVKKGLLKKARRKRQISNIEIFSKVLKLIFLILLIISAFASYEVKRIDQDYFTEE